MTKRLWGPGIRRRAGAALLLAGALALAWGAVTYFWQEPFTGVYAHFEQKRLAEAYEKRAGRLEDLVTATPAPASPTAASEAIGEGSTVAGQKSRDAATTAELEQQQLAALAGAFRRISREGEPIGRIIIPRLGINLIIVNGASTSDLRKGPGRDLRTFMPGEGELVYIAGHRTTYGAPFRHIDHLERGDRIYLELPYGRFQYRVTKNEVVFPDQVEKLRSRGREELALQASHPPYSARQRLIVHARFVAVKPAVRKG